MPVRNRHQIQFFLIAIFSIFGLAACDAQKAQAPSDELITETKSIEVYPHAKSVRLFIEDRPLNDDGFFGMGNVDGVELTSEQRMMFEKAIFRQIIVQRPESGEGAYEEACFIPHHFFRYFNELGEMVGEIEICFCCDGGLASPALIEPADDQWVEYDIATIKKLVQSMDLPTDVNCNE